MSRHRSRRAPPSQFSVPYSETGLGYLHIDVLRDMLRQRLNRLRAQTNLPPFPADTTDPTRLWHGPLYRDPDWIAPPRPTTRSPH